MARNGPGAMTVLCGLIDLPVLGFAHSPLDGTSDEARLRLLLEAGGPAAGYWMTSVGVARPLRGPTRARRFLSTDTSRPDPHPAERRLSVMSRLLTAVSLVLALTTAASAQDYAVDQGSLVLGGTVSFTSEGGELNENFAGDRVNRLLLNPTVLYFVTTGLGIGGDLYVEYASQGDASATTIAVGPEIAYYFGGPDSRVYPFISGHLAYASLSSDFFDASGIGFGLSAGGAFMLTSTVALTAQADYEITNLSIEQLDETRSGNTLRLAMGIAAFLF